MRTSLQILFTLPMFLLSCGSVSAQTTLPATPQAGACQNVPLQPDELMAIVAADYDEPVPLVTTMMAVDPETLGAVTDVVVQSLACTNANQPLRALAVFTDRYLAEHFAGDHGSDELGHLIAAASRSATITSPEDRIVLMSISNPLAYNGARIGITVVTANADQTFTDELVFVDTANGWRIDQVISGDADPDATPAVSPTA